ncbi:hypothetical protein BX666DRAFT_2032400 [Dichotomocladium elegans]|nr:hypothetical protein BX666DRAFT_2032400 [Dichotomocladium elegans]
MAEPSAESKVLEQLDSIYSKENLAKNEFFREMIEQDPDHWVSLKKFSAIKQFKELIKDDVEILIRAVELSEGRFEINEDKTKLRKAHVQEKTEEEIEQQRLEISCKYMAAQNARSIYAKGFPVSPESPSRQALIKYFKEFGRVLMLKMRTDEQRNFKGSVFVEYESPEVAKEVIVKQLEYEGKELEVMSKQEYIDMKAREKFQGVAFKTPDMDRPQRCTYVIQFEGAGDMLYKDIKELVSKKAKIGHLQGIGREGAGAIELRDQTPEQFLESLGEDHKIGDIVFMLADVDARDAMFASRGNYERYLMGKSKGKGRGGKKRDGFRSKKRPGFESNSRSGKRARKD